MNHRKYQIVRDAGFILLCSLISSEVAACSPVNYELFLKSISEESRWYWLITGVVACGIAGICIARKRIILLVLSISGIVFHPSWLAEPGFYVNCQGISVFYSQVLLTVYLVVLLFMSVKLFLLSKKSNTA